MFLCDSLAAQNLLKIHLCGCTDVHLYYNKTGSAYDPAIIPHQCSQQQPSPLRHACACLDATLHVRWTNLYTMKPSNLQMQ